MSHLLFKKAVGASRLPAQSVTPRHTRLTPPQSYAGTSGNNGRFARDGGSLIKSGLIQVKRALHSGVTTAEQEAGATGIGTPIALRPFQREAIEACLAGLGSGLTRLGVSSPTGSGKTTMFISLIPRIPPTAFEPELSETSDDKGRTLILVGRGELADQAETAARMILGKEWSIEVEQGRRAASGKANVTIAMWQSIVKPERLAKFDPAKFKLVVVDEAHRAGSLSYIRLLHHFNSQVVLPPKVRPIIPQLEVSHKVPILGFSATFSRPDNESLARIFEKIVFHVDTPTMVHEGWLSPARSTSVYADLDLDSVPTQATIGGFRTSWLNERMTIPEVNQLVVKTYLEKCRSRRTTLAFCVNRKHMMDLARAFQDAGVDARTIDGTTSPLKRAETLRDFKEEAFPVLVNCEILVEGTDIPEIDCIILARPTKSANLLTQMIGRGLRHSPHTRKTDCHIIDVVNNLSQGLKPMAILGTLPEDEEEIEVGNTGYFSGGGRDHTDRDGHIDLEKVKIVDEFDPFGIGSKIVAALPTLTKNAWVACGSHYYALELFSHGCIVVQPQRKNDSRWTVAYHPHTSWSFNHFEHPPDPIRSASRFIAVGESLNDTIGLADRFAADLAGPQLGPQLSRYAQWRSRPPSEKQLQFLRRLGTPRTQPPLSDEHVAEILKVGDRTLVVQELTAGEVHSLLCCFKHGQRDMQIRRNPELSRTGSGDAQTPAVVLENQAVSAVAKGDKPFYQKIFDFLPAFFV